jgi:hypothetical protein
MLCRWLICEFRHQVEVILTTFSAIQRYKVNLRWLKTKKYIERTYRHGVYTDYSALVGECRGLSMQDSTMYTGG